MSRTKQIGYGTTILTVMAFLTWFINSDNFDVEVSGNITCAGTEDNPCISYFNITSKYYVYYLYNKGGVKLDFVPGIKNYSICKPDGRYKNGDGLCPSLWREIDFVSPYYYKYKYVYKFYPRKKEQFMIVGIKNSPWNEIKWSLSAINKEIDPIWYSEFEETAWYKFENDVTDTKGNYDLADVGSIPLGFDSTNNKLGSYSADFNGTMELNTTFPASYTNYSLSFWLMPNSTVSSPLYILNQGGADDEQGIEFNGSQLSFVAGTGSTQPRVRYNFTTEELDVWAHFVFVANETDLVLYKNGTVYTKNPSGGKASVNKGYKLRIGNRTLGTEFIGKLDDFRIFLNQTLNQSHAETLYNEGVGTDSPLSGPKEFALYLDEVNSSRHYEFRSLVNVKGEGDGEVCVSLTAPGFGQDYQCGTASTSFIYNISLLRQTNFSNGSYIVDLPASASSNLNVSMDNKTEMVAVRFNISSTGTSEGLNISYWDITKRFTGSLIKTLLVQVGFYHSNTYKEAVNLSYSVGGSNYIFVNMSDNPENMTFQLTGFDLDEGNDLDFYDYFNETNTTTNWFNKTMNTSYPVGIWDNFEINTSKYYDVIGTPTTVGWVDASDGYYYYLETGGSSSIISNYLDLRNNTIIEWKMNFQCNCWAQSIPGSSSGASCHFGLTDGTTWPLLFDEVMSCEGESQAFTRDGIITLMRADLSSKDWDYYFDGVFQSTYTANLDDTKEWNFKWDGSASKIGTATADASNNIYNLSLSGIYLNKTSTETTYDAGGEFISDIVNTNSQTIAATMTWDEYKPAGTSIYYYLSLDNSTWEEMTWNTRLVFGHTGGSLSYKVKMNTSNTSITPAVYNIRIQIIPSATKNISVDLGDDGADWNWTGTLNSSFSPQNVSFNESTLDRYAGIYTPVKISSATAGLIQIDSFNLNSSINPIVLNHSLFETCFNCMINFSFDGDSMNVSKLQFDFLGDWNYSATAVDDSNNNVTWKIMVHYSPFNLSFPKNIHWIDFLGGANDTNASAYGQTSSKPIRNVTHKGYGDSVDIYVKTNATTSCLNHTLNNNSGHTGEILLDNSYQRVLKNVSVNSWKGIWMWESRYSCTSKYYLPYIFYASICSGCVVDTNDMDNYNLLVD